MAFVFISQLDDTIPIGTTLLDGLKDEITGTKGALKKQFPNFTADAVNCTPEELNHSVGVTGPIQTALNSKRSIFTTAVIAAGGPLTSGISYLVDTRVAGFTLTLPSPQPGMAIGFKDAFGQCAVGGSKNFTIGRNGSEIEGFADDLICDLKGASFVLKYIDATYKWRRVEV